VKVGKTQEVRVRKKVFRDGSRLAEKEMLEPWWRGLA
jgi:hypothetical protein